MNIGGKSLGCNSLVHHDFIGLGWVIVVFESCEQASVSFICFMVDEKNTLCLIMKGKIE